jgi:hypothetical protein
MHIPEDANAVLKKNQPATVILAGPNLEDRGPENYTQGKEEIVWVPILQR